MVKGCLGLLLGVLLLAPGLLEAQTVVLSDYTSRCERCVRKDVAMGHHDFCALSVVQGSGPQSFCSVHRDPNGWILTAVNPANDPGGAQVCSAVCMDFGSRARPTPPPPDSPESLVGSWEWPGGSTMVVSPGGTVVWIRGGEEIASGTWTSTKARTFVITHLPWIDTADIQPGGASLNAINQNGQTFTARRTR